MQPYSQGKKKQELTMSLLVDFISVKHNLPFKMKFIIVRLSQNFFLPFLASIFVLIFVGLLVCWFGSNDYLGGIIEGHLAF